MSGTVGTGLRKERRHKYVIMCSLITFESSVASDTNLISQILGATTEEEREERLVPNLVIAS